MEGPAPRSTPEGLLPATLAVACVSVALLMFEILQTVTLSLQVFPSNAFLVISVAMFGLGAGGSLASLLTRRGLASSRGWLFRACTAFALALLLSGVLGSRASGLPALIAISFAPYLVFGVLLSVVFQRWPEHAGRLYCANLVGSALGCAGLVLALRLLGDAGRVYLVCALLALAGSACLAVPLSRRALAAALGLGGVVALLWPASSALFEFLPGEGKTYGKILRDPARNSTLDWSKWGYLGRLDSVVPGPGVENFAYFGDWVRDADDGGSESRLLFASGDNWTTIVDFKDDDEYRQRFLREMTPGAPYVLFDAPDVLNIGVGGGVDVFLALAHGARSVVGVEINPLMIEAVRERHRRFFDDPYRDPRVTIRELDGRTFVDQTDARYDVVTLTAVDTGAGLAAGAQVLSEGYLYTREAFDAYLRVLRPDGVLFVYRPRADLARILATAAASLRALGHDDPERHFALFGGERWVGAVIGRSPLSEARVSLLADRRARGDFGRITYSIAGGPGDHPYFRPLLDAMGRDAEHEFLAGLSLDFEPVVDDRPFFYHFERDLVSSRAGGLLVTVLVVVGTAATLFILLPLLGVSRTFRGTRWPSALAYFFFIGLAFMFVELALIQKLALFLGHPTYSLAVTLFTILVFSGIGSLLVDRLAEVPLRLQRAAILGVVLVAVVHALGLRPLLESLRVESLAIRAGIVVALLAPGGILMGMPFPSMMRRLTGGRRPLVCWAWGINALASTVASTVAVMISMTWGFTATLLLGAACYLLALACSLA